MIVVTPIPPRETFAVRHPVLRAGKPLESCFFEGDELPTTIHFGVFVDKKLTGVVSVYRNKNSNFKYKSQFQMRGMAVLADYRKKGLGELLVQQAERHVMQQKGGLIWFNARESAVGFYEKMGYEKQGAPFDIGDIGPHYIMFKKTGYAAYD